MRTSNKILLGAFITLLLITVGIHVVLYAKIKNGDLEVYRNTPTQSTERVALGVIKHVVIKGMENVHVFESDTAAIEMYKNWQKHFKYRVSGDTLAIEGNLSDSDYQMGSRVHSKVDVFIPPVQTFTAIYSGLTMQGADDTTTAVSRDLKLFNSELFMIAHDSTSTYWKSMNIYGVNCRIYANRLVYVQDMTARIFVGSTLTEEGASFGSFSLSLDSTSSVNLRTGSLQNLKTFKP